MVQPLQDVQAPLLDHSQPQILRILILQIIFKTASREYLCDEYDAICLLIVPCLVTVDDVGMVDVCQEVDFFKDLFLLV